MARVKTGYVTHRRHKRILKLASGYFGSKHRLFKTANEQLLHSYAYAFRDRHNKKREFRKLWITRINAACKSEGLSYSRFIYGLEQMNIQINRKMLSELAISDTAAFNDLVSKVRDHLANAK